MVINTKTIVAQIIGFIALVLLVIVFQKNNRKTMLQLMMVAAFLFSVHFFMLGAMTGAAMNLLNVFRSYVFQNKNDTKWASHRLWLWVFLIAITLLGIYTWAGYRSLFVIIAMGVQTTALWMNDTKKIRFIALLAPPFWFAYNLIVGSIPGMITEAMILGSLLVGIYRFDIKKQKPLKNKKVAKKRIASVKV